MKTAIANLLLIVFFVWQAAAASVKTKRQKPINP